MIGISAWHRCLLVALCGAPEIEDGAERVARVQSRVFDIAYSVNPEAFPLDSVGLWYTQDRGKSWHQYGFDADRQSPITFNAPGEGLFGFFFVVVNATGASSHSPGASTAPHQWAFVDFTPPIVQVHAPRQTTALGQSILQIRWTAIDAHLKDRPIEVQFRYVPDATWHPVSVEPLANTGRYDWRIPEGFAGPLAIRVTVGDRGGHRSSAESEVVEIAKPAAVSAALSSSLQNGSAFRLSGGASSSVSKADSRRAARLHREGMQHRSKGDYRQAISRMRVAVALNPEMTDTFVEMADMLYLMGDLEKSLGSYEIALSQEPTLRAALQGAARVDQQLYKHSSAARRLRTILLHNPNDAEVWMNLGDVAVLQGDAVRARECYTNAATRDPTAAEVIESARKRLAIMADASRAFREGKQ